MPRASPGAPATFGEFLRYLRRRAQMTQQELGIALGYSDALIARLEHGERLPDLALVKTAYTEALGLQREPALAEQLVELAERARAEHSAQAAPQSLPSSLRDTNPYRTVGLPAQLTHFIGRVRELTDVIGLLREQRLVTLTGTGGVGKTRLAQEAGQLVLDIFPDGVWLAELAPVSAPNLVADTVAVAFGLQPMSQTAIDLIRNHLRDKQTLLVLDNCEHLIQACAELVEMLLRACPRLHILATSREALRLPGEATWQVPSLAVGEAVVLFVERACNTKPSFALTEQNTAKVTSICERLDGIPLAIELVAARLRSLSVDQVASRLDDRFRLLTGGSRTALPRHQTLRAAVDWSYDLLSYDETRLLRYLSVFAGGWDIEAAELVWGGTEALELLDQLVNKSLVLVDDADEPRYHLLETIREYAHEKLVEAGEYDQVHRRHAQLFAELAQRAKPYLHGPQQYVWFNRLEADIDNLRAALTWTALVSDPQTAERLIDGIWWFWFRCGYGTEGMRWIDSNLIQPAGMPAHARALGELLWGSLAAFAFGNEPDQARIRLSMQKALERSYGLGDVWLTFSAELMVASTHPDLDQQITGLQACAHWAHELGWKWEQALALGLLSGSLISADNRQAENAATRSMQLFTELGDRSHVGWMQRVLGELALRRGDAIAARSYLEESVITYTGTRDHGLAAGLSMLAMVALVQGDTTTAKHALQECMPNFTRWGSHQVMSESLVLAGCVAQAEGQYGRAIRALAAVMAYYHTRGEKLLSDANDLIPPHYERCLTALRDDVDVDTLDHEWAEGLRMALAQAIETVLRDW
jgi:predicted ATPase/DNA-binding XRE family transcriptional regulator